MGLSSRSYMNRPESDGAVFRGRSLTTWIIVLNVAIFILWQFGLNYPALRHILDDHLMVSADGVLRHGRLHTLFTSAFSHFELWHIFFNMLFLHWFGRELETMYGARDYSVLYLSSALLASISSIVLYSLRGQPFLPSLGASGAIMGVVVVYAFHFPDRKVYFYGMIPITVRWLAILYIVIDSLGIVHQNNDDHIAHAAHLGGALMGLIYYKFDLRLPDRAGRMRWRWPSWLSIRRRPKRTRPEPAAQESGPPLDPAVAERVDALLDKIKQEGIHRLTDEERKFLDDASRHYRR